MPEAAKIKRSEFKWAEPIEIKFGFSGLDEQRALLIMKSLINDNWPTLQRPKQCVYIIRVSGSFAIQYKYDFSPVIYIGEGDAYHRVRSHAGSWLVDLVRNIPGIGIDVRVAEIARKNHPYLYKHIEADMLDMFRRAYGSLPWFNQQSETSKQNWYNWESDAVQDIKKRLGVGSGNNYLWAIQPTKNNRFHRTFRKGDVADT